MIGIFDFDTRQIIFISVEKEVYMGWKYDWAVTVATLKQVVLLANESHTPLLPVAPKIRILC
jgi:hypothetical protein